MSCECFVSFCFVFCVIECCFLLFKVEYPHTINFFVESIDKVLYCCFITDCSFTLDYNTDNVATVIDYF